MKIPRSNYICSAYESSTITHFIIPLWSSSDASDTSNASNTPSLDDVGIKLYKFSFVGHQSQATQHLLYKLSNHQKLSDSESKKLNIAINKWDVVLGDISRKYTIHYIYQYLQENTPVYHVMSIISRILSSVALASGTTQLRCEPHNILIYKYNKNMDYEQLVNYINYIFGSEQLISNEEFFDKLMDMSHLSKVEIEKRLRSILSDKYRDGTEITFMNKTSFAYTYCLHSEELLHFLLSIPCIVTHSYLDDMNQFYYGHIAVPEQLLASNVSEQLPLLPSNIGVNKGQLHLYQNLSYYSKTINNEYYVILESEMKKFVKDEMYIKYFYADLKNIPAINPDIYSTILIHSGDNHPQSSGAMGERSHPQGERSHPQSPGAMGERSHPQQQLEIDNCATKNMIIEFNSMNASIKINLNKIFQNYATYSYMPVIKYYINGSVSKYKFYRAFLTSTLSEKYSHKMYLDTGSESGTFLQFKWIVELGHIYTIEVFDNLLIRMYIDEDNYKTIDKITPYLDVLTATIKGIRRIINLAYLTIPSVNSLFQEYSSTMYNHYIVSGNILISGRYSNPRKRSVNEIVTEFAAIVRTYPQFLCYDILGDMVKLYYKQVNQFYHVDSIHQLISNQIRKHGIKLNVKADREKLIKNIRVIFLLEEKDAIMIVDKWSETATDSIDTLNIDLKYGIDIGLKFFKDNKFEFEIKDNLDSLTTVKKILYYFECILYSINSGSSTPSSGASGAMGVTSHPQSSGAMIPEEIAKVPIAAVKKGHSKKGSVSDDEFQFDMGLDLVLDDSSKSMQVEGDKATNKDTLTEDDSMIKLGKTDEEFKGLKLQKIISGSNRLEFHAYLTEIYKLYDPQLELAIAATGKRKGCDTAQSRQAYPVSRQALETFDAEAYTGFIKYRNNYYICPRMWDYKANKPVSIKAYVAAGMKSPYSGGKIVPPTSKKILDDKHTLLLRKQTTGYYWHDPVAEKTLPSEFSRAGKLAYPGLTRLPGNMCQPCCFFDKPSDYDPAKKELQQIYKFKHAGQCKDTTADANVPNNGMSSDICVNDVQNYIMGDTSTLLKCRFGQLPHNINLLLNNHQEYFISKNQQFMENSNFFLRRGVADNEKYNFLESIATIADISIDSFINKLVNKIDIKLFLSLNNGELIDIYASSNILPSSVDDLIKFKEFAERERVFFNLLDVDYEILDKLNFAAILEPADTLEIKKVMLIYKIYRSYYNFIRHLLDRDDYKNYTHFIDLVSRPLDWLFATGVNIIIFDKHGDTIQCNPYLRPHNKHFIFLIRSSEFQFIPIYHIIWQDKKIMHSIIKGVINIDTVDISSKVYYHYKDKLNVPREILTLMQKREENILNFILMHQSACRQSMHYESKAFLHILYKHGLQIEYSVLATTTQFEYISFNNGVILPVYPCGIELEYGRIRLLAEMKLTELDVYLKIFRLSNLFNEEYQQSLSDLLTAAKLSSSSSSASASAKGAQSSPVIGGYGGAKSPPVIGGYGGAKSPPVIGGYGGAKSPPASSTGESGGAAEKRITVEDMSKIGGIFAEYDYIIRNILINEIDDRIIGIKFMNGLIMPIKPEPLTFARKKAIERALDYTVEYVTTKLRVSSEQNLEYSPEELKELLVTVIIPGLWENSMMKWASISTNTSILDVKQLIISDYAYNHFKYEFSRIIQDVKKYKKALESALYRINLKLVSNEINIYEIASIISTIMKDYVVINNEYNITKLSSESNLRLCYKSVKKCNISPYCGTQKATTAASASFTLKGGGVNEANNSVTATKKAQQQQQRDKECKIQLSESYYEYFVYLLANDLINNIVERNEILEASYIPLYTNKNYLLSSNTDIIIGEDEISRVMVKGVLAKGEYSKHKTNQSLSNLLFTGDKLYTLSSTEIEKIVAERGQQLKNLYSKVINDITNANIRNIIPKDVIIATVFDKEGRLDPRAQSSECIFPFFGKGRNRIMHHCVSSDLGFKCPVQVNEKRIPTKWGYCPENPEATKVRMKLIPVRAVSGDDEDGQSHNHSQNEFVGGQCQFPHLKELSQEESRDAYDKAASPEYKGQSGQLRYKLQYSCLDDKTSKNPGDWYSWCPTKLGYNPLEYPLYPAAEQMESIIIGKYKRSKIFNKRLTKRNDVGRIVHDFAVNPMYLETKKRGYCQVPSHMVGAPVIKDGVRRITLSMFNPQKCNAGQSKSGYTKDELYLFGVNELKIPQTELLRDNLKLEKPQMCEIIKQKYREIMVKTKITDEDRINVYRKDLNKCKDGIKKGGYNALQLREMAITYFGMDEASTRGLLKDDLCDYIIPIIRRLRKEDTEIVQATVPDDNASPQSWGAMGVTTHPHQQHPLGVTTHPHQKQQPQRLVYPGDISKCTKNGKKGGMSSNKLKKIAVKVFHLDGKLSKAELCRQIEDILNANKSGAATSSTMGHGGDKSSPDIGGAKSPSAELDKPVVHDDSGVVNFTLQDLQKIIADT